MEDKIENLTIKIPVVAVEDKGDDISITLDLSEIQIES